MMEPHPSNGTILSTASKITNGIAKLLYWYHMMQKDSESIGSAKLDVSKIELKSTELRNHCKVNNSIWKYFIDNNWIQTKSYAPVFKGTYINIKSTISRIMDLKDQFIQATIKSMVYRIKEDTQTSFYFMSGDKYFPNRLSISFHSEITKAQRKGRMLTNTIVGEIKGTFTQKEESPLKRNRPFNIHSKIFRCDEYPHITGFGTIAVTGNDGKITKNDEAGLMIIQELEKGCVKVFFMAGINGEPDSILSMMQYVSNCIRK